MWLRVDRQKARGSTRQIINLLLSPGNEVLSEPAVISVACCIFPVDIGYVTVLSAAVTSAASVSAPATYVVTLYLQKSHFRRLPASCVQSQKPFMSAAHQIPSGAA